MIPVYLRFQAFESYVKEQSVDFEKLSKGGLFLINGETGAGKSAILDAMTYALYGETSGGVRDDVRCLYTAASEIPTEVEFIFEISGKRYRFTRSIRRKKRADGFDFDQNAFFLEDGNYIPFEANPTKTRVRSRAEELLGLSAEQFRQIVVLPQGKFEKFLTSDSGEKEQILTTLFHAEKYTKISENLKAFSDKKNLDVSFRREGLSALLKGHGFEDTAGLNARRNELSEKNKSGQEQLARLTKETYDAEKLFQLEKSLWDSFEQLDLESARRADLLSRQEEIAGLEQKLERGNAALKLTEPFGLCTSSEKELTGRLSLKAGAEALTEKLSGELNAAEQERSRIEEQAPEHEKLGEELLSLRRLIPVYEEIDAAVCEEKSAGERLKSTRTELEENDRLFGENAALEEALSAEIAEIKEKFSEKIPSLKAEKSTLEAAREKQKKFDYCKTGLDGIRAEVEKLRLEAETAKSEWQVRQEAFDKAYSLQLSNLTAVLAEKLADGAPCPVCGSVHHPVPFRADRAELSGTEQLEQLKAAAQSAKDAYDGVMSRYNREFPRIAQGEQYLNDLAEELSRSGWSEKRYSEVCGELSTAEAEHEKLPALTGRLTAAKSETARLAGLKSSVSARLLEETSLFTEKRSKAKMLREQQKEDIPGLPALNGKISGLEQKISGYKAKSAEISALCQKLSVERASAVSALNLAKNEVKKAETAVKEALERFRLLLAEQKFRNIEEWRGNLSDEKTLAGIDGEIRSYRMNLFACENRCKELSGQLSGKTRPDLEGLKEKLSGLKEALSGLSAGLAVSIEEEKRLDELKKKYDRESEELEADWTEAEEMKSFAELFQGRRGQSFTRYVLGTMLSMITAEANRLLADVHGGQFRIYRKTEGLGNNRRTGLELEVQSAMAEYPYSVKSLSGGEKFLVSLALSMALSSILQSRSGGISIEAMFIDEGFGSLDGQSLQEALNILIKAAGSRRTVGIISHVTELKELIHSRLEVTKDADGSRLKMIL